MKKYVLLTGATGLLGRYLIRDLLLAGQRLAILVRPGKKESARQRMEAILQHWEREFGHTLPRPVCLEGDICQEGLALDAVQLRWIAEHCESVLHNAASLAFDGDQRDGEPWRTNVDGTKNMLQTCYELGIRDLHYVSTAYVCGHRQGLVMEDDLDFGQEFRNSYEQSKLEAEKVVRDADFLNHLTIYRPGVIAGDSKTGYTSTYHGLYMYLKLMAVMVRNLEPDVDGFRRVPMRMNVDGDEPRNIVAVDWVSAVISYLVSTPEAHDKSYHITPDQPITTRQIIDYTGTYLNSAGVQYVGRDTFDDSSINKFEQSIYESTTMYDSYNATDPQFDTTNLQKFAPHLPCPQMDEEMIHLFMRYGDADRWGKRRTAAAPVEQWADELLPLSSESSAAADEAACRSIGFDILGPGGGQWHARLSDRGRLDWMPGLPSENAPILRFDSPDLFNLIHGDRESLCEALQRSLNGQGLAVSSGLIAHLARLLQRPAPAIVAAPVAEEVIAGEVVEAFASDDEL